MFDAKDALKDKQNTTTAAVLENQKVNQLNDDDIHQMPEKFLPKRAGKRKASGTGDQKKVLLIIVVLIFFLSALISGAIIYLKKYNNPEAADTNVAITQKEEEPVVEEEEEEPVVEEEEEEPVVEEEENTDLDADSDQLTLYEEELFQTNPDDDDSDKDGYKDGSELVSLYNPSGSGQLLVDSGMVTIYKNPNYAYSIFFPSQWVAASLTPDSSQMKFLTDKNSGEFVLVQAFNNDNEWDILEYKTATNVQGLKDYSINGIPALLSSDGLTLYTINEEYLYQINLDKNLVEEDNFNTVFSMMINSFEMIESEIDVENPPLDLPPTPPPGEDGGHGSETEE